MALKRFSESVEFFPSAEEGNAVDMKIDVVPFLHRPKDSLDADTDYSDDSLVNTDGKITLENLAKAIKSNQTLATVSDVETEASRRESSDDALSSRVSANESAIATLNGTGDGSVAKTVTDKIAEVVAGAPEDFDTLKEISDWVSSHSSDALEMNSEIQANKANIAAEAETRASEDTLLQTNISNEETARAEADTALQQNISAETSSRTAADTALQTNIDSEASARKTADDTLQANIDSEAEARLANDTALQESIGAETSAREASDSALQSGIASEENARKSADTALQTSIDDETSARTSADATLQKSIDSEISDRKSAVSSEASARESADTTLQASIDNETSARQSADTTLQGNIDNEASARQSADNALQSAIDANTSGITKNVSAISTETSERKSADTVLQTNIDSEASARSSADSSLQTQITTNGAGISEINKKIPAAATDSNQLADKAYVNSSIATATATFRGTFTSLDNLKAVSADDNDYAFHSHVDEAGNTQYDRYKYTYNSTSKSYEWVLEYTLNNSSFTAEQWASINSEVTKENYGGNAASATNATNASSLKDTAHSWGATELYNELRYTGTSPRNKTVTKVYASAVADSAGKVGSKLSIKLNSKTAAEFDGSAAKEIDITPSAIGAAASGHTHTLTPSTASIGSASGWSAGSKPVLGEAISADDITSWNAGSATSLSYSDGVLTITAGSAPSLQYTSRSIPNVTSVGSLPSLTVTGKTVMTGVSIS